MKRTGLFIFILALVCGLRAQSPQPYLVVDFAEKELPAMLDLCHQGGFEALVVKTPFSTCGHYQWNETFAPEGNKSVRRMVKTALDEGVTLGLLVQEDVVSVNDDFFSPRYFSQFQHSEPYVLFDELAAEDEDIALRRKGTFKSLSALNLLLIDEELISFGAMEFAGDLILLHHCTRGLYGTKRTTHSEKTRVYRLGETPDGLVIPEGDLRKTVHQQLTNRLTASDVSLVIVKGAPGQELIEESIRALRVEQWENEGLENNSLGWFVIHAGDKKRAATTLEDLEWVLSKATAYHATYGLLLDATAIKKHGSLPNLFEAMKRWNTINRLDVLTASQKEEVSDPYIDWHLEKQSDSLYLLYPLNYSRRYQGNLQEIDTGLLQSENWVWKVEQEGQFGLRLQVEGEVDVINPMINTSKGLAMFTCTIQPGQRLVFDSGETAYLMDANSNLIKEVYVEGLPELAQGDNEVNFFCEVDRNAVQKPQVKLRYITREQPFEIHPYK